MKLAPTLALATLLCSAISGFAQTMAQDNWRFSGIKFGCPTVVMVDFLKVETMIALAIR